MLLWPAPSRTPPGAIFRCSVLRGRVAAGSSSAAGLSSGPDHLHPRHPLSSTGFHQPLIFLQLLLPLRTNLHRLLAGGGERQE